MVKKTMDSMEYRYELRYDVTNDSYGNAEWDGYERSILRRLADEVKIGIRGSMVEMTVSKRFEN